MKRKTFVLLAIALSVFVASCDNGHKPPPPITTTTTMAEVTTTIPPDETTTTTVSGETTTTTTTITTGQYRGTLSICADDALLWNEDVIQALKRNWINMTFYINPAQVGTDSKHFGWPAIISLYESGHEIGNHTYSHKHLDCSQDPSNCYASDDEFLADVEKANTEFLAHGLTEVFSVAYPFGENPKNPQLLQGIGITSARIVGGDDFISINNVNPFLLSSFSVNKNTIGQVRGIIQETMDREGWLRIVFHLDPDDPNDISPAEFIELMDYIGNTDIYTANMSDGLKRMLPATQ